MSARLGFFASWVAAASAGGRPGRVVAAFALGAAIAGAIIGSLTSDFALAHGPGILPSALFASPGAEIRAVEPVHAEVRSAPSARRHKHRQANVSRAVVAAGRQPVCVRLCDGFFFPLTGALAAGTDQAASCNSLCPDSPTDVYYQNGKEKIEDSISASGMPYSALPVSLRYRGVANATCTCHRDPIAYSPLRDATLRWGDAIMTPAGFVVFKGVSGGSHSVADFSALSAASVPAVQRGELSELEKASVQARHPSLKDWLTSQAPPTLARIAPAPRLATRAQEGIRLDVWRSGEGVRALN